MKFILTMIVTLLATSTMARGRTSHSGSYHISAQTEEQVIAKAQSMMPAIMNMEIKSIRMDGRTNRCSFRSSYRNSKYKFDVKGVSVTKLYKVDNNQVIKPYYRASIRYVFGNCRDNR